MSANRTPVRILVKLKEHSLPALRYAAYAMSGDFFVRLEPAGKGLVAAEFRPKRKGTGSATLKKDFLRELADEKLREELAENNRGLREFLLLKALSGPPKKDPPAEQGLTPEQEKELADLIAQVEKEIKREAAAGPGDPRGITRTWEEKYGGKKAR